MALAGRAQTFGLRGKENEDISLTDVVKAFNSPINEEQAWAVCYQCVQRFIGGISEKEHYDLSVEGGSALLISRDGSVSFDRPGSGKGTPDRRQRQGTEHGIKTSKSTQKSLESLGLALFQALDYGLKEHEERHLSQSLEHMLELITSFDDEDRGDNLECHSADDEGIEHDAGDEDEAGQTDEDDARLQQIVKMCQDRLSSSQSPGQHYKAVCRALAAEVVELNSFLDKITGDQQKVLLKACGGDDITVDELDRSDWASLWVHLMRELRHGVKLKKVEHINLSPMEYELTPYEVLMEDIRSRRYNLNKIMVNGDIPRKVKNYAHDVILDFIRSRPPLTSARDRVLREAPPKLLNEREKLLDAIRRQPKLKPLEETKPRKHVESSRTTLFDSDESSDEEEIPVKRRTLIIPEISLLMNESFSVDEDEEDTELAHDDSDHDEIDGDRTKISPCPMSPLSPLSPLSPPRERTDSNPVIRPTLKETDADDLISNRKEKKLSRRHSITVCESPNKKKWQNPIECLSLRLDEVVHIREVLTKAELETLSTKPQLYNQIAKLKLCFTCKKTKFTLFGQWGTKCQLCKRTVCTNCLKKMRIPGEHFEKIPVYALSPTPISPENQDLITKLAGTGSTPPSPVSTKPIIRPLAMSSGKRRPLSRSHTIATRPAAADHITGPQTNVCCECKNMLCEIIRVSRTSVTLASHGNDWQPQRSRPSRNFHLDLKPV